MSSPDSKSKSLIESKLILSNWILYQLVIHIKIEQDDDDQLFLGKSSYFNPFACRCKARKRNKIKLFFN